MQTSQIDHIGIAVKNIEEAAKLYTDLGLKIEGTEVVESQKVKVAFIGIGQSRIELLESTAPDGNIAKFIESKGEGIHHLAVKVDHIEKAMEELTAKGY
ncbi:MAG: VOC family protein, partial [bacterium]|nr:VOC family protein [bacterium]